MRFLLKFCVKYTKIALRIQLKITKNQSNSLKIIKNA
jgi:hypothetical protein